MTALEIYRQDIQDRDAGDQLPRQQYYCALRDALHHELMEKGYSDFLEELLLQEREERLHRIYVADYAALMECHSMAVLGRNMRDATEYVPHLRLRGQKARWDDLEQPGNFMMPVTRDIVDKIRQLRSVSRQLVDARDQTVASQASGAAQREIEQVQSLNRMLDERCKALQDERDELQIRLKLAEEGVITEQVRYAIEARRIQEEEALRRSYEQQSNAAAEAFRSQYRKEQRDANARREEEERLLTGVRSQAAEDHAAIRREIAGDVKSLTALLTDRIAAWQQGLDRAECRMLADSYLSLHDLLATDTPQLMLTARCEGASEPLITAMTDMELALRARLQQLETAMLRLGLLILRPAQGDALDSLLHLPVGTSIGAVGDTRVKRCLRPGVMLQGQKEAMVKAQVETE